MSYKNFHNLIHNCLFLHIPYSFAFAPSVSDTFVFLLFLKHAMFASDLVLYYCFPIAYIALVEMVCNTCIHPHFKFCLVVTSSKSTYLAAS